MGKNPPRDLYGSSTAESKTYRLVPGTRLSLRGTALATLVPGVSRYHCLKASAEVSCVAEFVASVPTVYKALIGDHAAHPGEGLGNRARQRAA